MVKTTTKSVAIALTVLAVVVSALVLADGLASKGTVANVTALRVSVVDLDGAPIHNAKVTVSKQSFFCDNKGRSPQIVPDKLVNAYDGAVADWYTVTVAVQADDFVPSVVFNCVVYLGQTRQLTVRMYPDDGSDLPVVTYVESPPSDYVKHILDEINGKS